ncbi:NAD(P)-binding protein [Hoylesella oralis]
MPRKRCLVLERRAHIGGNIRDDWIEDINVHLHGAHIFHTDNEDV